MESTNIITEHVLEDSSAASVPVTSSDAVYVAIDPTQPEVQQLLGQIQVLARMDTADEPVSQP